MVEIGTILLAVGFGATVASATTNAYASWTESRDWLVRGRLFTYLAAAAVLAALGLLIWYFLTDAFRIAYVAENSMRSQPLPYKLSALWSGQSGSLLLWTGFLAVFAAVVARTKDVPKLSGYASAVIMLTQVFFLVLLLVSDPFQRTVDAYNLARPPADGIGLNPLLQNPGMFFHPPTLYAGYAGFVIPFAFAVAGLLTRDESWVEHTRRWTVFAWLFLSIGILIGAWWAYVILGWGGYWAWDPVENASLLPWLTGTAFLHSVMIQERRGRLRIWNHLLIVGTYLLTIYGVFLTRSGIVTSVHSFARSAIAPYFVAFMAIAVVSWGALLAWRWEDVTVDGPLSDSIVSKEVSFLLNNLVLLGLTFVVFWGTSFPFLSALLLGSKVSIGTTYYNELTPPLAVALLVLLGICPLIPWQRASLSQLRERFALPAWGGLVAGVAGAWLYRPVAGLVLGVVLFVVGTHVYDTYRTYRVSVLHEREMGRAARFLRMVWNNRRRYGGYVVHIGVLFIVVGITWSTVFAVSETVSVGPGERVAVPGGYSIEVVGFHNETHATHVERGPVLAVYDGPGPAVYRATPAVDRYPSRNQTLRDPDIWSTTSRDVYFIFNGVRQGKAFIEVKFMPLVSFLWYGGGIVIVGGLLALWPEFGEGGQGPPGGGGEINSETVTDETEGNEREENDGD